MTKYFCLLITLFLFTKTRGQEMVTRAKIEFEVRTNIQKTMGDDSWREKIKEALPQFSTKYFNFIFNGNQSIYHYTRSDDKVKIPSWINNSDEEETTWYHDYAGGKSVVLRSISGEKYLMVDSLRKMEWKITNESREIAGFSCRKAVSRLFDSVYVFAFYTDDIMISGGPMSLCGLPGMILGVTIPRMFTSYIATSVQVVGVDEKKIVAPAKGKAKTNAEIRSMITDITKNWDKKYRDKFIWGIFL